jgi:AcrR family transcriptional regulator
MVVNDTRRNVTRDALLDAAERLFAAEGIANTSARAIIHEAGQRNESALQYHFGGRDDLIEALHARRGREVDTRRLAMLATLVDDASVREICALLIVPVIDLAREDKSFTNYLTVIGQVALSPRRQMVATTTKYEKHGTGEIRRRLRARLGAQLPENLFDLRFENVGRLVIASLAQKARERAPFSGADADLFVNNLIDVLAAMLSAPPSAATNRMIQ